jgi:hypothetical protein
VSISFLSPFFVFSHLLIGILVQEAGSLGLAAVKQGAETVSGQLPLVKAKAAGLAAWVRDSTGQLLDGKVDWDKVRRFFIYKM